MVTAVLFCVSLLFPQSPITIRFTSLAVVGIGFQRRTTGMVVGRVVGWVVGDEPLFRPVSALHPPTITASNQMENFRMKSPRDANMSPHDRARIEHVEGGCGMRRPCL